VTRGAGAILIAFGLLTFGAAWVSSRVVSLLLGALLVLAGALTCTSRAVDAVIKVLEAGTEVGAKNISEVKAEIADDLKRLKTPIVVVLDDVDRLTPSEILEVFQLIKANGDFPNLIYLVLYERTIVEKNIEKALNVPSGREYLEKIVQVGFDVPMVDVARVHQLLFKRLDSLLSDDSVSARFSIKRWANVFGSSLHSYFMTLRDVNRFTSTLAFHVSSLLIDGAFEVNPIDLIGLEVIRLYEPEVYKALRSSKDILTATSRPEKPRLDAVRQTLVSIVDLGFEGRRDELRELVKHLFPTTEWAFGGPQYSHESGDRWYRDLRICSSKVFDRYFRLTISEDQLSQGSVQKLLAAFGSREALRSELEILNSRGLLNAALEELAIYQDKIGPEQIGPFITAVFDVADSLSDEKRGMLEVPVQWKVGFLVANAIKKLSDVGKRFELLAHAMDATSGLFMPVEFVALMSAPNEDQSQERLFPESNLEELRKIGVRKIESAAASGTLVAHPRLSSLLGVWRLWGKSEDVKSYVEGITGTPQGTTHFLKSFVVRSVSQQSGDYLGTERRYIRSGSIEPLISLDSLSARVNSLHQEGLSDEDRDAINAFTKAIERKRSGKSDDFARD
jgi:predicted KAP-like P-loop ATPase